MPFEARAISDTPAIQACWGKPVWLLRLADLFALYLGLAAGPSPLRGDTLMRRDVLECRRRVDVAVRQRPPGAVPVDAVADRPGFRSPRGHHQLPAGISLRARGRDHLGSCPSALCDSGDGESDVACKIGRRWATYEEELLPNGASDSLFVMQTGPILECCSPAAWSLTPSNG
jgi:hypothetical protein